VPVLGIVENLSGYHCPGCGVVQPLFEGDAGRRLATAHGMPLLARLPFTRAPLGTMVAAVAPVADAVLAAGGAS
jgi:Mrp family chromosome partitioning ATPase